MAKMKKKKTEYEALFSRLPDEVNHPDTYISACRLCEFEKEPIAFPACNSCSEDKYLNCYPGFSISRLSNLQEQLDKPPIAIPISTMLVILAFAASKEAWVTTDHDSRKVEL